MFLLYIQRGSQNLNPLPLRDVSMSWKENKIYIHIEINKIMLKYSRKKKNSRRK